MKILVPFICNSIRTKHMDQLYFQAPYKAYQEIFVFVKNALMCHYHQTEQKWSTSRDALTPYLQYKGVVHKRRHQFSGREGSKMEKELRYLSTYLQVLMVGGRP